MSVTEQGVDQFHQFARRKLESAGSELSWDDLWVAWQAACERDATNPQSMKRWMISKPDVISPLKKCWTSCGANMDSTDEFAGFDHRGRACVRIRRRSRPHRKMHRTTGTVRYRRPDWNCRSRCRQRSVQPWGATWPEDAYRNGQNGTSRRRRWSKSPPTTQPTAMPMGLAGCMTSQYNDDQRDLDRSTHRQIAPIQVPEPRGTGEEFFRA